MASSSCDSFLLHQIYTNHAVRLPLGYRRDLQQVADDLMWTSERTGKAAKWENNLLALANLSEVRHGFAVGVLAGDRAHEVPGYRLGVGEPLCYLVSVVAPRKANTAWRFFSRLYHDALKRALPLPDIPLRSLPAQRPPELPVVWLCYTPAASYLPAQNREQLSVYAAAYAATLMNTCRRRLLPERVLPPAHECEVELDESDSE